MFSLASPHPQWVELFPAVGDEPAVEVEFAAIGIATIRAARRAVAAALGLDPDNLEEAGDELSREIIRRGIRAWRGIGDEDGVTLPVSPSAIEVFIADPRTFEAADRLYVLPWIRRDAEKNGSPASPDGTGEAGTPAADIASSPAKPKRRAAARTVRTGSTSPKRTTAPGSGKS